MTVDEYGKNMVNVWKFVQTDGSEIILVSDLMKDRIWMGQEKPEGLTPWMHLVRPELDGEKAFHDCPRVMGEVILGQGRANIDHTIRVFHYRMELEGMLPTIIVTGRDAVILRDDQGGAWAHNLENRNQRKGDYDNG